LVDALKQHYHSFDEFDSVAQGLLQILPETAPIFRHHLYEWGGERPFRAHDGNDIHWDLEKMKELLRSFYEYVEGQTLTYPGFITIVEAFDAFFVAADISFPFGTPGARARFREDWRANYAAEEDRAQNGAVIQAPCEIDDRSSADIDMDDPKPDIQPNSSPWQDNDNISSASTDPPSHLSFSALAPYTKSSTVSSAQSFRHIAQNPVSMPSASPITASLYAPISLKTLPSKPLKSATLASRTCLHTSTPPSFAPLVSAVPSSSSPTALPDSNGTSVVGKSSYSSLLHRNCHSPLNSIDVLPAASTMHSYLPQNNSVLTTIDDASLAKKGKQRARTATADSGYACPETSTSGSATATLGNAAPVSAADIPRTAILSTSEEDIKSGTGVFAPSPLYSSTRLKAMFAHSDFGGLCHTSRLTLEKRITNRLHPDCPENTFLRRACEYFSKNTVTKWQLLQDSFDIVNFRNSMHMLRRKTLNKCPLSTFHHKSAELSQAIKDMELWFQGIKLGHDQAPRKVAPIKKRGV
jgi:hypothetical protein